MLGKKTIVSLSIVILAVFWRKYSNLNRLAPIVEIETGKLQGITSWSRNGRQFFEYLNINYAKPPVGDLRFEPPQRPEPWTGVRDASRYGPKCLQFDLFSHAQEGDEDCLQVNVHSPRIGKTGNPLPVMVFIHGGLFIFGSGVMYRPDYFMDSDVVLVTLNYRLAALGFLNTGDGVVRGNMGLKDQVLALKWVQRNIEAFGGDPNRVTIFGESAGGASVHYHTFSPMSRGLFHKAITQSGLTSNPWALHKTPAEQAKRFADIHNCSTVDTKLMVSCLKNLTAHELVSGHEETQDPLHEISAVFVPTMEIPIHDGHTFISLSEDPKRLLASGKFYKVPMLSGVNADEGLINAALVLRNESLINLLESDWDTWIPRLLYLDDDVEPTILHNLRDYYLNGNGKVNWTVLANLFSDRFWNVGFSNGMRKQVEHSSEQHPVFLYYYSYRSDFTLTDMVVALKGEYHPFFELVWMKLTNWFKSKVLGQEIPHLGICHGDELSMQFYIPLMSTVPKDSLDYKFSEQIVKTWTSFASSGTTDFEFLNHKWPRQESDQPLKYMKLDKNPGMITEPFTERVEFWNSLNLEK